MQNKDYKKAWRNNESRNDFFTKGQESIPSEKSIQNEPERKAVQNFRDLKVWLLGKEISVETYRITRSLPEEELYGLTSQMRKAAISIPCNISEGHSRRATRDYQRFLKIAAGSCAELETHLDVALELGYLKAVVCGNLMEKISHETRMLRKLISKLSESSIRHPSSDIQKKERAPSPLQY